MLMTILVMPSDAHAQSGPAPAVEAPIERARRDAEKVYQLILLHADKPRKAREERVVATPAVPRVAPGAAPTGSSAPKPPSVAAASLSAVLPSARAVPAAEVTEPRAAEGTNPDAIAAKLPAVPEGSLLSEIPAHNSPATMALAPTSAPMPLPATPAPAPPLAAAARVLELVSSVEPDFPSRLVRRLVQGSVVVNFDVLPDGSVGTTTIVKSSHPGLNAAAQAAVAAWRFKPISATTAGVTELRFE